MDRQQVFYLEALSGNIKIPDLDEDRDFYHKESISL